MVVVRAPNGGEGEAPAGLHTTCWDPASTRDAWWVSGPGTAAMGPLLWDISGCSQITDGPQIATVLLSRDCGPSWRSNHGFPTDLVIGGRDPRNGVPSHCGSALRLSFD
jgi:hypothetical protein